MTQQTNSDGTTAAAATTAADTTTAATAATATAAAAAPTTPAAPDKYEAFTLSNGLTLDDAAIAGVHEQAKALGLSQENAQKLAEHVAKSNKALVDGQAAHLEQTRARWDAEAKADKEFGGDKLAATLATAKKARDTYGSPALIDMLERTGLGNHPEVIRFFAKVGATLKEDTTNVQGGKPGTDSNANSEEARARRMYPTMAA